MPAGRGTDGFSATHRSYSPFGAGKRLFGETAAAARLRMVSAQPAAETLIVTYEPATRDDQA